MRIEARLLKLESMVAINEKELYLVGWTDADFYTITDKERQQVKDSGNPMIWRD